MGIFAKLLLTLLILVVITACIGAMTMNNKQMQTSLHVLFVIEVAATIGTIVAWILP